MYIKPTENTPRKGRPAVLLITRNFPPLRGGMERLNWHLADELSRFARVTVIAPKGAKEQTPSQVTVEEVALKPLPRFLVEASVRAWRISRALRPKIVLAGSGLTAPIAVGTARRVGAKAVAYVHGLDLAVNHFVYRRLWLPAIRRLDQVIANSSATARLTEQIGVPAKHVAIVHPGVAIPTPDPQARTRFRAAQGIALAAPLLLSVGRLTARKGLCEFVREVLPAIVRVRPDARLAIVGETPTHALAAQAQTSQAIQAAADAAGVGSRLRFLGKVSEEQLTDAYFAADVHVFPVREIPNDPEGFGMVAIEAAAHGLPTVAYATGGVVDAVADGLSGKLVPPGDAHSFAQTVLEMLTNPLEKSKIQAFATQFAWSRFGDQLAQLLLP